MSGGTSTPVVYSLAVYNGELYAGGVFTMASGNSANSIAKFNSTTGIEENSTDNKINVFPNPFSVQTVLQTGNYLNNVTLTVYNCFGQTVAQIKNLRGQTITFNRDNLASGLYFVRITTPSLNPSPNGGGTQGGGSEVIATATGKLVITDK